MAIWVATLTPPLGDDAPSKITWTPPLTRMSQIQQNDTIIVKANFGAYVDTVGQQYSTAEYWNLHVAAVPKTDLETLNYPWWFESNHQSVDLINITTEESAIETMNYPAGSTTNYCTGATSKTKPLTRGGTTSHVIYQWSFTYARPASDDWGLVFAYGDPHIEYWNSSEVNSNRFYVSAKSNAP